MLLNEPIQPTPARVSILARIVPAFSYGLPALGAAISAILFFQVMRAMRYAEAAGIAAVSGGLAESNLAILVTLYASIFVGLVGVGIGIARMFSTTRTASPSGWFFIITSVLGFLPMLALWRAQSLIIDIIFGRSPVAGGVSAVAAQITVLLQITIVAAAFSGIILLLASVVPLPAMLRAERKWPPALVPLLAQIAIIAMTVAYQWRTSWLYEQVEKY